MSVQFNSIYENDNLKEIFAQSIENSKLLHAVILEGADGTGKMSFAKEIAKAVCCSAENKPCGYCESCRKIEQNIAVDISYFDIPEGKSEINVEIIRNIREDTYTLPCETESKFYIINNAQAMNINAQNAFLKILEEPPSYVYFIILCTNSSLLLPTVRSRAPIFRMQTLEIANMREILLRDNKEVSKFANENPEAFDNILQCSDGSLGYCIARCCSDERSDDISALEEAGRFLELLVAKDRVNLALLCLNVSSNRNELDKFLSFVRCGLRDIIVSKKTEAFSTTFYSSESTLPEKSDFSDPSWMNVALNITENAMKQNSLNCNVNIVKTDYFSKIGALCRR